MHFVTVSGNSLFHYTTTFHFFLLKMESVTYCCRVFFGGVMVSWDLGCVVESGACAERQGCSTDFVGLGYRGLG